MRKYGSIELKALKWLNYQMKILVMDHCGTTQYTHDAHVPFGSCNSDKKSKSAIMTKFFIVILCFRDHSNIT